MLASLCWMACSRNGQNGGSQQPGSCQNSCSAASSSGSSNSSSTAVASGTVASYLLASSAVSERDGCAPNRASGTRYMTANMASAAGMSSAESSSTSITVAPASICARRVLAGRCGKALGLGCGVASVARPVMCRSLARRPLTSVFMTEEWLLRHSLWPGKQVAVLCLAHFERLVPGEGCCWFYCTV